MSPTEKKIGGRLYRLTRLCTPPYHLPSCLQGGYWTRCLVVWLAGWLVCGASDLIKADDDDHELVQFERRQDVCPSGHLPARP